MTEFFKIAAVVLVVLCALKLAQAILSAVVSGKELAAARTSALAILSQGPANSIEIMRRAEAIVGKAPTSVLFKISAGAVILVDEGLATQEFIGGPYTLTPAGMALAKKLADEARL